MLHEGVTAVPNKLDLGGCSHLFQKTSLILGSHCRLVSFSVRSLLSRHSPLDQSFPDCLRKSPAGTVTFCLFFLREVNF